MAVKLRWRQIFTESHPISLSESFCSENHPLNEFFYITNRIADKFLLNISHFILLFTAKYYELFLTKTTPTFDYITL
ncbi:hypothetical protein [Epilithonimonas vandammei]|uniref:hypothetical protein n=1 Tax=Epilithonimonas vandammei TaxID=2487072 RepID=UPI0028A72F9A|nr:hypothetical protein [Epilithonimonas vandammei]